MYIHIEKAQEYRYIGHNIKVASKENGEDPVDILSYIYYKIHSFYICNAGNNFIHVSGLHILNGISVQN